MSVASHDVPTIRQVTEDALDEACARLRAGELVAFPTETVYGLGGATMQPEAIARIYALKRRPADNPLIAHVLDAAQAAALVSAWDSRAAALADRFWPGPLTLVLPKADTVPDAATGGRATLAVRSPAHPASRELLRAFGGPISAPSANRSGHISPTRADHVASEFPQSDLLIIDGGPCTVGIESTVLDLAASPPRILRPGSVSREAIEAVIGPVDAPLLSAQDASPGTAESHYAPRAPARLVSRDELERLLRRPDASSVAVLAWGGAPSTPEPLALVVMPENPVAYATRLYAALREADERRPSVILIERPPVAPEWGAVDDRLRRACARGSEDGREAR